MKPRIRTFNAGMAVPLAMTLALVLLFTWTVIPVYAHGESIDVSPTEAKPGDTVTVTGAEFPPGEEVELSLEGIRGDVSLGHAEVGEDGQFSIEVTVPAGTTAGSYQFVAATEDDRITLDFSVLEGGAESAPPGGDEIVFQRSTTETIIIGIIAVVLAFAGIMLVLAEKWRNRIWNR